MIRVQVSESFQSLSEGLACISRGPQSSLRDLLKFLSSSTLDKALSSAQLDVLHVDRLMSLNEHFRQVEMQLYLSRVGWT